MDALDPRNPLPLFRDRPIWRGVVIKGVAVKGNLIGEGSGAGQGQGDRE